MWMLGYENGDQEFNFPADNSFNRKLRPLIPRANHQPPCLSRFSGAELFSLNNHFSAMGEQTRRTDLNLQQPVMMSSRWNPTPEQLRTLEELYRRGTRTPSADQIQHITAQLRRYGKIEGKNVFYWFQNHKARERLKRRRQMESAADDQHRDAEISERKDSGENKTMDEADEQNKNDWTVPSTLASASAAKELVPIQTAAKGTVAGESRAGRQGWIQLERGHDPEFHLQLMRRRSFMEKNATWQKMQQLPSNTPMSTRSAASHHVDHNKLFVPTHDHEGGGGLNHVFLSANHKSGNGSSNLDQLRNVRGRGRRGESLTLELFPLSRDGGDDDGVQEKAAETASGMSGTNSFRNSYQYFEFLPLKN